MRLRQSQAASVLVLLVAFVAVVHAMTTWDDAPGVTDNICYLRQAHLFGQFGLGGLDTDIRRDADWLADPARTNGLPCHHFFPASGKTTMQYPPGTGFLLALFPEGWQTPMLYIASTSIVFLVACAAILLAWSPAALYGSLFLGLLTLYFMVNPTRSSDSMAPTMALCCLCGAFTAAMFRVATWRASFALAGLLGLLFGIAVDLRIANLLLGTGYFLYFVYAAFWRRQPRELLKACVFAICIFIGILPTLSANYINVGSPIATAYTGADVAMPDFSVRHLTEMTLQYAHHNQGIMLWIALVLTLAFPRVCDKSASAAGLVVAANLIVNMGFYLTHALFYPYYAMAIATLTIWTILFSCAAAPRAVPGLGASAILRNWRSRRARHASP